MNRLGRRRVLSGALASAVLAGRMTASEPAEADFFGGDLPLLAAILVQSISTVTQLT